MQEGSKFLEHFSFIPLSTLDLIGSIWQWFYDMQLMHLAASDCQSFPGTAQHRLSGPMHNFAVKNCVIWI